MKTTKNTIILSYMLTIFCYLHVISQNTKEIKPVSKDTVPPKWYNNISLRQSFKSITDKAEPAYATLIFPKDSTSSQNFSFALGYTIFNPRSEWYLYPFIEWQRNTLTSKKQNTFLTGLSFLTPIPTGDNEDFTLYGIASLNYKHDAIKKTEGTQASLYFSPTFKSEEIIALLPNSIPIANPVIDYFSCTKLLKQKT